MFGTLQGICQLEQLSFFLNIYYNTWGILCSLFHSTYQELSQLPWTFFVIFGEFKPVYRDSIENLYLIFIQNMNWSKWQINSFRNDLHFGITYKWEIASLIHFEKLLSYACSQAYFNFMLLWIQVFMSMVLQRWVTRDGKCYETISPICECHTLLVVYIKFSDMGALVLNWQVALQSTCRWRGQTYYISWMMDWNLWIWNG